VFLARAIAQEADVLLLDEPFSGVDKTQEAGILALLRDLAADRDELGRNYLQVAPTRLTDTERDHILDDIDHDLATAHATIGELPRSSRRGVHAAHALFAALSHQLRRTPAATIAARRVRVPTRTKIAVLARVALADARPGRTREVTS